MEIDRLTSSDCNSLSIETSLHKGPVRLELEDLFCILQIDSNDSLIALELARRLGTLGRIRESVCILRSVIKIDSRFETMFALAQAEYEADLPEEALQHLQSAVMIAPNESPHFFDLFKMMGNLYARRGDLDWAEDSYNKAYRLNSESDVLLVNMGSLAIQRQQWDEALERFRQAIRINPKNDKAWVGLGLGHRVKGDFELAWGNIEAAHAYNPLNEVALSLALEWGVLEHREFRVLEMIRKFLIEGGWSEKLSLAFAWLSFRRGDRFLAHLELERLLAVNPANEHALTLALDLRVGA